MNVTANTGRLYVVATPIGNLGDISSRALQVLAEVDFIAAEDTRHSRKLLTRYGLQPTLVALHEHNERQQAPRLVERMRAGESAALVSDAGTPLLSDPGYRLVALAAEAGLEVVAVPGPSAVTAALSVSGLPTDRFAFEGFPPSRGTARRRFFADLRSESRTLVFFESSHRIVATLADLEAMFGGDRGAALCRELTKRFETVLRGSLGELRERVANDPEQRMGEFVLVVAGCTQAAAGALERAVELARALHEYLGASQAARVAARIHDVGRRDVYEQMESRGKPGSE